MNNMQISAKNDKFEFSLQDSLESQGWATGSRKTINGVRWFVQVSATKMDRDLTLEISVTLTNRDTKESTIIDHSSMDVATVVAQINNITG